MFSLRANSSFEFVARIICFITLILGLLSIFVTINLNLRISSFQALAIEISAAAIIALYFIRKKVVFRAFPFLELIREFFALGALVIYGVFCLTKVHSNYVGIASNFLKPVFKADGFTYPYPFFSDEWYAIALTQKSLADGLMPFYYPFSNEKLGFINVQWFFHNFNTGFFQLFSLDPLTSYVNLGIAINTLIVCLCYCILRSQSVSRMGAFLSSALIFHITHASNFPTIWSYLPIHLGILFFLAGVLSLNFKKQTLGFFFWAITFLAYPPLIIFIIPFIWVGKGKFHLKIPLIYFSTAVLIFVIGLWSTTLVTDHSTSIWHYIFSRLIFLKPSPEVYDVLNPFNLISIATIGLAFLGFAEVKRRTPILLVPLFLVTLFWLFYSQFQWRLIIDYPRVAFVGAIWTSLIAGFGLDRVASSQPKFRVLLNLILTGYLVWYGLNYTQLNKGQSNNVELKDGSNRIITARPPANYILHPDDLQIAKKLNGEFLISDPWKSTVLATAAQVRPLFLKSGTISDLSTLKYDEFVKDICTHLKPYWRMRYYLYFHESIAINCEGIVFQESSSENFKLYFHGGVPH